MNRARLGLMAAVIASAIAAPFVLTNAFADNTQSGSPQPAAASNPGNASPIYEGYRNGN